MYSTYNKAIVWRITIRIAELNALKWFLSSVNPKERERCFKRIVRLLRWQLHLLEDQYKRKTGVVEATPANK